VREQLGVHDAAPLPVGGFARLGGLGLQHLGRQRSKGYVLAPLYGPLGCRIGSTLRLGQLRTRPLPGVGQAQVGMLPERQASMLPGGPVTHQIRAGATPADAQREPGHQLVPILRLGLVRGQRADAARGQFQGRHPASVFAPLSH